MIHFTPIQKLGKSNSSYSLADQLAVNSVHHSSDGKKVTFDEIKVTIIQNYMRLSRKKNKICFSTIQKCHTFKLQGLNLFSSDICTGLCTSL